MREILYEASWCLLLGSDVGILELELRTIWSISGLVLDFLNDLVVELECFLGLEQFELLRLWLSF